MKNRSLLLLIAVVIVGLFALPNALSLFAGQHSFSKAGGEMCPTCHSDVVSEMASNTYHLSITSGTERCEACHTTGNVTGNLLPLGNGTNGSAGIKVGFNLANGTFTYGNGTQSQKYVLHAAITVECVSCHYAVNFTDDAHKPFYTDASAQTWLKGANEACYGCHTKVVMSMTWVRKGGYNYSYDFMNETGVLAFNGTNVTTYTNNTG